MADDDAPLIDSITALHDFLSGRGSLGDTLTRVADLTMAALHAEMASLTMLDADARPTTVIYTDGMVTEIDQAQYDADRGPCLDAFHTGQVLGVEDACDDDRWPEFAEAARRHGIHSTLSLPLVVAEEGIGALNLYAADAHHFGPDAARLGTTMAAQAAMAVRNATAYWEKANLADQLSTAMASRAIIEQAKGVIMATAGCSADEAFDLLRQQSQAQNRKLRDVAGDLVQRQRHPRA